MRTAYRYSDRSIAIDLQRRAGTHFTATLDGEAHEVDAVLIDATTLQLSLAGRTVTARVARRNGQSHVAIDGIVYVLTPDHGTAGAKDVGTRVSPEITAPMPGKVLRVFVTEGQEVNAGDPLLILEAMKMETRITADAAGIVRRVAVEEGQMVDGGQLMIEVDYRTA